MATILCLETATTNCSVGISVGGTTVVLREDNTPGYSHAEKLHVFIEQVLVEAGINKTALDAIAVSRGPGSYTGLRIGVSAAKGMCFALDIPLVATDTLMTLAVQAKGEARRIIPMLDARRMEVYTSIFNQDLEHISETQSLVLSETSFQDQLEEGEVLFLGNGISKFKALCQHPRALFMEGCLPSAAQMGPFAEAALKKGNTVDVAYFEPFYLKDFISR